MEISWGGLLHVDVGDAVLWDRRVGGCPLLMAAPCAPFQGQWFRDLAWRDLRGWTGSDRDELEARYGTTRGDQAG